MLNFSYMYLSLIFFPWQTTDPRRSGDHGIVAFPESTLSSRRTGTHWLMIRAGVFRIDSKQYQVLEGTVVVLGTWGSGLLEA